MGNEMIFCVISVFSTVFVLLLLLLCFFFCVFFWGGLFFYRIHFTLHHLTDALDK